MKTISTFGHHSLICSGEDGNPASSTVGMNVVHWSRPLTADEIAAEAEWLRRIQASAVNPKPGQEQYGAVHTLRTAWIESLPRVPMCALAPRDCDRPASGHGGHPDLCGVHADAEHALGRETSA